MQTGKIPELKITSMKTKIIKVSILSVMLFLGTLLISSTYYVAILQYPAFFGDGIFTFFKQRIYLLNIFDKDLWTVFHRTPLATG